MKTKYLSAAVASALLFGAQSASALSIIANPAPALEVWMSGATAQDPAIRSFFTSLCVPGTLDTYLDNGATPGGAHRAYYCTVDATKVPGMAANKNVVLHKRSSGGSALGVQPLLQNGIAIRHMSITNNNCTLSATPNQWTCTTNVAGDLVNRIPDGGVSDMNPEMFRGDNTPAPVAGDLPNPAPADPADVTAKLVVSPAAALIFGIPVTLNLYNTLQNAQIAAGRIPNTCAIGDYTEECMPSLSKQQVATILSGGLKKWTNFNIVSTAGANLGPLSNFTIGAAPTTTNVGVCRRVNGSGTQSQANLVFLNNPCSNNPLNPNAAGNVINGPTVVLASSAQIVESCLNDFNNGTNLGGNNANSSRTWAIGVQSLEFNATNALNYRFVKIDDVAPTLKNTAEGKYIDWVEQTFQWRKNTLAVNPGPSGDALNILTAMAQGAATPAGIAAANATSVYTFGASGSFAVSTIGANNPTVPFNPATPVIGYTHLKGSSLDNCRAPTFNPAKIGSGMIN